MSESDSLPSPSLEPSRATGSLSYADWVRGELASSFDLCFPMNQDLPNFSHFACPEPEGIFFVDNEIFRFILVFDFLLTGEIDRIGSKSADVESLCGAYNPKGFDTLYDSHRLNMTSRKPSSNSSLEVGPFSSS